MITSLMPVPKQQYLAVAGIPLVGGRIFTYAAGTSTPKPTYSDSDGTIAQTNPIVLNSRGEPASAIFWSGAYKVVVQDVLGNVIYTVDNYNTDPAGLWTMAADFLKAIGSSLIGFIQSGAGAVATTAQTKLRERVSVADFIPAAATVTQVTAAVQSAINSGAKRVFITGDYTVNGTINLVANQVIDFDGGSLTLAAGAVVPNGVLYGLNKAGIRIVDPIIDASAAAVGETGINLKDCPNGRIDFGTLTKANLVLQATSNATRMGYKVRGTVVNLSGWGTTGVYVSAANGVNLSMLEVFGGKEGVGIYNDARNVKHSEISSYGHTQDGFVIIAGQRIEYTGCFGYSNGQSGFTTQRLTLAENTRRISYVGCHAYDNVYDGFDIRGGNGAAYAIDMIITLSGCISSGNTGTGYYIVYAEGTTLTGCVALQNTGQGFFIDNSGRAQLAGCRSNSNANGVAAGANKAGIIVYNSNGASIVGCVSSNDSGATQSYGISFTGTSAGGQVNGGYFENNITGPAFIPAGNRMFGAQADTLSGSGVFTRGISWLGCYDEEGFGVPVHVRPKGSTFMRTNGGGGEFYVSDGAGAWTAH